MKTTEYEFIETVGCSELAAASKVIELANGDLNLLKGYFLDLRKIKRDSIVAGGVSSDWLDRINNASRDLYIYITDKDLWWEMGFLMIRTKAGKVVPIKLNKPQGIFYDNIRAMENDDCGVRIVLLKARQWGGSTATELYYYLKTKHEYNSRAMIVADKKANSINLFGMYTTAYAHDPTKRSARMLAQTLLYDFDATRAVDSIMDTTEVLYDLSDLVIEDDSFDNVANGGYVHVESGFSRQSGRSWSLNHIHCSEVAYWEDADASMQALLATVPRLPNTSIIIESTGKGIGDAFHELWKGKGDDFKRIFIPWYEIEEYAIRFKNRDDDKRFEDTLSSEEIKIQRTYDLTLEQLQWRRNKIAEFRGNTDRFGCEFPATPDEAFLGSGRPVFGVTVLKWYEDFQAVGKVRAKYRAFDLIRKQLVLEGAKEAENHLKVYHKPKTGSGYVIGVDVSEGIIVKDDSTDYSCIQVLEPTRSGLVQCAEFVGKVDPDVLAEMIELVAEWYNNAWVNIEANNHGLTTITELKKSYSRIMRRPLVEMTEKKKISNGNYKSSVGRKTDGSAKLGWLTTAKTRPQMVDDLARFLFGQELLIYSPECLQQLHWFIYDDLGRPAAQVGKHDDIVMSLALAVQCHIHIPYITPRQTMEDAADVMEHFKNLSSGESYGGFTKVD